MPNNLRLASLLVLLASSAVGATSTVTGSVHNATTGVPLASMVVAAYDGSGTLQATASTDSAGHYLLQPQAGNYRILAYDPAGIFATVFNGNSDSFDDSPIVALASQPVTLDFALQTGVRITGSISATGGPVAATVAAYNLSGTRRGFTQADTTGAYSLLLPPGQYKIVAFDAAGFFAPRFYPDVYGFDPAPAVSVPSGVAPGKNIDLEPAGHLGGTVIDFDTASALAGTTVYAYNEGGIAVGQTSTDTNGRFVLNLPADAYRFVATDHNRIYATGFLGDMESFDQSLLVSIEPQESRLDLQIPLHRGGTATGHVTGVAGALLPNITIAAYNADGSLRTATTTDASGAYSLVLPGGSFRLAAYDAQLLYATQFYPSRIAFAEANGVPITPSATTGAVDFALVHAGRIAGTVTESGNAAAAFSVGIAAYDSDGLLVSGTASNAAGAYTLVLPPGNYKIVAFDSALRYATAYGGGAPNYDTATVYTLNSDQTTPLNFTVSRGIHLSGSVSDWSDRPLSGIEIGALDLSGNRMATTTATNGGFAFVLLPGSYKFLAADLAGHYSNVYYSEAVTLAGARTVLVQPGTTPPAVVFILGSPPRHRAAGH